MSPMQKGIVRALGSLKLRITLGGVVALALGISVIAGLLVNRAEHDMLRVQRQRQLGEAARTAAVLSRSVVDLQRALQAVAAQLDPATLADDATLTRFIEGKPVLRDLFSNVFVAAPDGRMRLFYDETGPHKPAVNLADRDYFKATLSEGRPIISGALPGRVSHEPVIVLTHPVRGAGGISAVLGGALRLASRDLIADLVDAQEADAQSLLVVTDAQGRVLAHPKRGMLMQPLSDEPRMAEAYAAWAADGSAVEPSGLELPQRDEVVAAAGVAGPNWMVWRARPESELLAPLRAARRQAMAWAAGLIALLSVMLLAVLHWLLRPMSLLEQRAQHLFDGQFDPHAGWPAGRGEIGRLGHVLKHVGAERARLEAANAAVLRQLGSVMSAAPLGIAFTRNAHFELVSAEFCRLVARPEADLLGQPTQIIFASNEDYLQLGPLVASTFASQRAYKGEWQILRSDGAVFWASLRGKPVDAADHTAGTIWTLADISEQVGQRVELEWSASHDTLTGLANRKAFEQRAAQVVAGLPRSLPAVIVFIDLDHFKPINDTAGHAAGDAMLRAAAAAILSKVRGSDLVVRLGGDEFALLLESCSHEVALRIAENVREAVAAIELPWQQRVLRVGASLGVASLTAETASVAAWVHAADEACYAAKAAGRGAVRASPPVLRVVGAA